MMKTFHLQELLLRSLPSVALMVGSVIGMLGWVLSYFIPRQEFILTVVTILLIVASYRFMISTTRGLPMARLGSLLLANASCCYFLGLKFGLVQVLPQSALMCLISLIGGFTILGITSFFSQKKSL